MTHAHWRILTALDEGGTIKLEQSSHTSDKVTLIKVDSSEQKLQTNTLAPLLRNRWICVIDKRGGGGSVFYYKLSDHGREALNKANHPPGKYKGTYACIKCTHEHESRGKGSTPKHCRKCGEQNCMKKI